MKSSHKKEIRKDYYRQLSNWITDYEEMRPVCTTHALSAISDKIGWCWKFKKITEAQKDELCDRMIALYQNPYIKTIYR